MTFNGKYLLLNKVAYHVLSLWIALFILVLGQPGQVTLFKVEFICVFSFLYKEIGISFLLSNPSNMKLHMQCEFTASLKLAQVTTPQVAPVQLCNSPSWNWLECTPLLWVMKTREPFCAKQKAGKNGEMVVVMYGAHSSRGMAGNVTVFLSQIFESA